jgi:hypothetical protein
VVTRLPIIRTSERRDFGRCEWRWRQAWRRGLKPLGEESVPLVFGSWVHEALAAWYLPGLKRGPHPTDTFLKVADDDMMFIRTEARSKGTVAAGGTEFYIEEKLVPARELGVAMLNGYVEWWGSDDSWEVIQPEWSGEVTVTDGAGNDIAIYGFTYDGVYRDLADGRIKLMEHKTAKAIFTDHLPLDQQAGSYWAIAGPHLRKQGLLKPREDIAGITYNFLRKSPPDERPRNAQGHCTNKPTKEHYVAALAEIGVEVKLSAKLDALDSLAQANGLKVLGEVSALQPKPLFEREFVTKSRNQRQSQIGRIQLDARRMNELRTADEVDLRKTSTRDCSWDCSFYNLCLLDEEGGDTASYRKDVFRVQDPYAAHRKSTEE